MHYHVRIVYQYKYQIVWIQIRAVYCVGTVEPHTYFLGISDFNRANADCIYGRIVASCGREVTVIGRCLYISKKLKCISVAGVCIQ